MQIKFITTFLMGLVVSSNAISSVQPLSSPSLLTSSVPSENVMQAAYEGFQADADIVRLHHLKYWVTLIEAYHEKMGRYPFEGEQKNPIYVFVATPQQLQYISPQPPPPATDHSMKEFVETLEAGLGIDIDEYYDPQFAPDAKPNFYIYMIDEDRYYFAIHTHQKYAFSKTIAPNYNKVEVSNIRNNSVDLILLSDMLFHSDLYKEASDVPLEKLDFFEQRIALTLHETKQ